MFQKALEVAGAFTFPYVGLRRKQDGTVYSTLGAFVVVNTEGWIITSGHLVREILQAKQSDTVTQSAEIWALPGFASDHPTVPEFHVHAHADLAALRLTPFDPAAVPAWPVFREGRDSVKPGTSICRVGFPWHQVEATFDDEHGFLVQSGFPVPTFALDGMVSRFHAEKFPDGTVATSIETSTPGLRGQSGGPLLDTEGHVCGLQSGTAHYDLGFDATYQRDGEQIVERQFLNVGRCVHVDDIKAFLDVLGVTYATG